MKRTQYSEKCNATCLQCGERFYAAPSHTQKGWGKCCSRVCSDLHKSRPLADRLWEQVDQSGECWKWTGRLTGFGYGIIFVSKRIRPFNHTTHRVAWALVAGAVPKGMGVLHTCDNPACVRNDDEGWYEVNGILRPRRGHLFLGTRAENNIDKETKGRGVSGDRHGLRLRPDRAARGEQAGAAKLRESDVRDIRRRFAEGITQTALAIEYGVGKDCVSSLILRRTWKHIA